MAFQPSKSKKNHAKEEGSLNMNSMMDMMTIILLFLIKSYSTTGIMVKDVEGLTLAQSIAGEQPRKVLSIAVDRDGVWINQDGQKVGGEDGAPFATYADLVQEEGEMEVPRLLDFLKGQAAEAKSQEQGFGIKFTGEINIVADTSIAYNAILKVLQTCGKAGYYQTQFLVGAGQVVEFEE